MTTIQLLSDLHLEFGGLELSGGDVLLLAGDITVADYLRPERTDKDARNLKKVCDQFFFEECDKYKKVFYIAGNHEHYSGVYEDTHDILRQYLNGTNVTYLQNEVAEIDDNTVVFGDAINTSRMPEQRIKIVSCRIGIDGPRFVDLEFAEDLPDHFGDFTIIIKFNWSN